jgi:hypothetical protein
VQRLTAQQRSVGALSQQAHSQQPLVVQREPQE